MVVHLARKIPSSETVLECLFFQDAIREVEYARLLNQPPTFEEIIGHNEQIFEENKFTLEPYCLSSPRYITVGSCISLQDSNIRRLLARPHGCLS